MFFLFTVISAFLAASALAFLCAEKYSYKKQFPTNDSSKASPKLMHSAYMDFCLSLFRSTRDTAQNSVLSPFSFGCSLMLLMEAAAGETQSEIQQLLGKSASEKSIGAFYTAFLKDLNFLSLVSHGRRFTAHVASALFVDKGTMLEESYTNRVKAEYDGHVASLNFDDPSDAAKTINAYVNESTRGLIPTVVDSVDIVFATSFLVNSICFKGLWTWPFDRRCTEQALFHGVNGNREAHFMQTKYFWGKYAHSDDLDAIQMHYEDTTYSLLALMPAGNFDEFLSSLDAAKIGAVMDGMVGGRSCEEDEAIELSFPRFDIASTIDGKAALSKLGVARCFAPGADLSRMSKDASFFVENCVQKAKIEVHEEGTVAAAATCYSTRYCDEPEKLKLVFDRPFIFLLLRGRSPVFVGQVV